MKLTLFILIAWLLAAEDKVKVSEKILAADGRCHYIIQGAKPDQLRTLNQQGRCVSWETYAKYEDHLAALRLYRAEVEKAWPGNMKRWDLIRDLKKIDEATGLSGTVK